MVEASIEQITRYWDYEWGNRLNSDGSVSMNMQKFELLVKEIWSRPDWIDMWKLDVGCGTGVHAKNISNLYERWKDKYVGIDLSNVAVETAKKYGINAMVGDFAKVSLPQRFDLFMFLDVLEHMPDHEAIARKVVEHANVDYAIYGNVPLYRSKQEEDGGFERHIDVDVISKFLVNCGCSKEFRCKVYGIGGWPYLTFEGESI